MRLELLGSGGATTIPRPGCACAVCAEARVRGLPYSRTGPSVFVHGPGLLVDTPEEAKLQLDRAGIAEVPHALYSHWHPDHTLGRRVFETLNFDFRGWPREAKRLRVTDVYLPEQVAVDFRRMLGGWDHLAFLAQRLGVVRVHELRDGDTLELDGARVRPFRLAEDYVYGLELVGDRCRALLVMDELRGWRPPPGLLGVELAVLPMGICEHHPLTGERRIHPDHPALRFEATFPETLEVVRELGAGRVVLTHVEEIDGLGHDDLRRVAAKVAADDGLAVTFGHDGLVLEV